MSTILIRMTKPPYGSSDAHEGLDFAISATNYGHDVQLLFEGNGVYQLLHNQQPDSLSNHAKRLNALPFYDIEACFVCETSIHSFNILPSNLISLVSPVSDKKKHALYARADHVVTF
ncbi:sulfurtransferase complex subunit TusC [Alteromonas sp. ASW11-130]|uniref:sulfurtransferase complex subunit TusC n=1 Tax=Alteromonas sp. ASW11-130 TaxID=3015775 RepID=UPI00224238FB|nr:sulfurtransferase complex subunit TusC [Alteromonas sp. ASW11-130]MCW8092388.1 sulfurtransferase complex subunit TusC [Alteromonas sp. ASW11-130]